MTVFGDDDEPRFPRPGHELPKFPELPDDRPVPTHEVPPEFFDPVGLFSSGTDPEAAGE